jgi:hypothetical protein
VLLTLFALHLAVIVLVSLRELTWLVTNDLTIVPKTLKGPAQKVERFALATLGEEVDTPKVYNEVVSTWLNLTGSEGGYGFFAPNISGSYRLSFEFEYPDGRIEHDLPHVSSEEAAVRVSGLLDQIARTQLDVLREALIKFLAVDAWRDHAGAVAVRASFVALDNRAPGVIDGPESAHLLYTFSFGLERSER